jgi:hypothetical protein
MVGRRSRAWVVAAGVGFAGCRGINPDWDGPASAETMSTSGGIGSATHGTSEGGGECRPHETRCSGECVDLQKSSVHCGTCDAPCDADQVCASGGCRQTCPGTHVECGDACVTLDVDPDHCGECDHACEPPEECVDGECG